MAEVFDVAVIGSGAGGAPVAALLAERGARVILVEKGGKARPQSDALDAVHLYYTNSGLTTSTGNCLLPIPTGTALGGTTQINSGTCLKTPDELLARWEKASAGMFHADVFRHYLDLAWKRLNVKEAPVSTMSVSTQLFFRGVERLGAQGAHRLSRAESGCVGSGRCCFVCPEDAKMTSEKAFLRKPIGAAPTIALDTELIGIESARRSTRLRLSLRAADGQRRDIDCGRLVLSCGTLRTPSHARKLRPDLVKIIGSGLSVHPAAKLFALFDQTVDGWKGVPQGGGLVDPKDSRIRYEGVYTPPELAAMTMPLAGRRLHDWLERYERVATFGWMIRDESRGCVDNPIGADAPWIRYDLGPVDLARMVAAMRFAGRSFFAAGARRVVLPFNRPDNIFSSAEQLASENLESLRPAQLQMMAFHPLGTCAMGRVVDENLKLCEGVYVCDGSVVPESLGVNPQITIYAFALRLADHLSGRNSV